MNPSPNPSLTLTLTLTRDQAIQWLRSQACQCDCTVAGGGESMDLVSRLFPKGISHVRGLCGPRGRRLDVTLHTDNCTNKHTDKCTGGMNSLIVHGSAIDSAEAVADGKSRQPGFAVIARMKLEGGKHYQSGYIPSTLHGRAVPCAPAESNGGQRCAALQEACTGMLSDLTTTLELQGVPGWPEIYGLGCCEYRLNATHAAPLVVDARQPLQTAPMWNPLPKWEIQHRRTKRKQLAEGASQDESKARYRVRVRAEASRDPNPS